MNYVQRVEEIIHIYSEVDSLFICVVVGIVG